MNFIIPPIRRRSFLRQAALAAALAPQAFLLRQARAQSGAADEDKKIEAALPARAPAAPKRSRRLLIFTLNVNYGGHPSILTANRAFTLMGKKTGAFETVVSRDPAVFERSSLAGFDAVFFNNTVGNCFEDALLRENLAEFVHAGGGLLGVHGTSVAFTRWPGAVEDWPEFGLMLGARGANHRDSREQVVLKAEDPDHPLLRAFGGKDFDYRDEFFRFGDPYSRRRVRVLLSIDNAKTDATQGGAARGAVFRKDNDYALAWVRQYGRGRVFYSTIAHNPDVFWDPRMLEFYLAAVQFALGDLAAPTLPSAFLTPAARAQERLGWRLALDPAPLAAPTLFEAIDQASREGVRHLCASSRQPLGPTLPQRFEPGLSAEDRRQVRLKLEGAALRLAVWQIETPPSDEAGWQSQFEFARRMGVETILARPPRAALGMLDELCQRHEVNLALGGAEGAGAASSLEETLASLQGRSPRIVACLDLGALSAAGVKPAQALARLRDRALLLRLAGDDSTCKEALSEAHRIGIKPLTFILPQPAGAADSSAQTTRRIQHFDQTTLALAAL